MKKIIGIILFAAIISASVFAICVSACNEPISSYKTEHFNGFWFFGSEHATATLNKCNCSPVNNYLAAWIKVQHYTISDGVYVYSWIPASGFYYNSAVNVSSQSCTINADHINYVSAKYVAYCGNNAQVIIDDSLVVE